MNKILETALSKRMLVVIISLAMAAIGLWAWTALQKEAYPDVGDTQVTVITEFKGRAAAEVESQVTVPLEKVLNGVPQVISRRSKTIFGLSVISLTFADKVEDYWARQRVMEKLSEADLPTGVSPGLAPLTGPVGEILRYMVRGPEDKTSMDLRTIQDWVVTPKLLKVPGVADVITFGGLVKQYHVITSPDLLSRYKLSIQNVIDAIQNNNLSTGGNIIARGEQGFAIRSLGALSNPKDIENVFVTTFQGVPIFVKDIGSVEPYPMPRTGILGISSKDANGTFVDDGNGVQGLIAMRRGENASEVVDALKAAIKDINGNDLKDGVRLEVTYDRGDLVNYTIRTVAGTLFEGITIVAVILIIFLGSFRSAVVVATVIPLSLLFAFALMKATNIPANLLSLGAIDFGIIVDGAVVMVENILRHYRIATPADREKGIIACTLKAANEVSKEIFFSIAIIISAFLPIFTFQRVEGKLFSPMAFTLSFAILGSLLLALTLVPVLMTFIFRKQFAGASSQSAEHKENKASLWLQTSYSRLVARTIVNPVRTLAVALVLVVMVIIGGTSRIGTEFLPKLDEGAINIRAFFPVGISIQEANTYTPIIRKLISSHTPVKFVVTQLGRNEQGTDPYNPNRLEILVGLNDYKTWIKDISKDELLKQIKSDLESHVPGTSFSFSQPILDNVTEAVTGSVADLAILVNGKDLHQLREYAQKVLDVVKIVPGAAEYGIEQEADQAQLVIDMKRLEIARFGINVNDIQHVIEAAIGGKPISTVYEDEKKFDIVVRFRSNFRSTLDSIRKLPVTSSTGAQVPLEVLAHIDLKDGPTLIQREDGERQISVRTNIEGRDQGSFVKEAQAKVQAAVKLPPELSMTWGGQFENLTRAGNQLAMVVPLTILLIASILYLLYKDIWDVIVAFSCIPFSLAGGIIALWIRGYNLNVSAGVGFISLFGVATMSGVLFVSRMNHLQHDHPEETVADLVPKAAVLQLRPWLTTVLPALFGLIPAAFAQGIGSDVQRPLATVIVGGLISGLLLTVTVLPSLYLVIDRFRRKDAHVD
ncbi:MAG: efflux RND transporter permease subunit [Chitinophagaceae bacterium]|nr:efflux RND transporter permease subunit [Oligoflexus sp.]